MRIFGSRAPSVPAPAIYLVSTAGHPNYGDEFITRAWLDHLAARHPDVDVWLDCPRPGRAAHLFAGTHPRLRTTDTLWELAWGSETHDPIADAARIERLVRDLGSPRFDTGLVALRSVGSIHLLGGGYLNDIWQDNLGVVTAVAAVAREFGVRAIATGLGVAPLDGELAEWLRTRFEGFAHVEARDDVSGAILGVDTGMDDAFLGLALPRPVFDERPSPERMILVQGDLRAWEDDAVLATIDSFAQGGAEVGFAEAIPPDDTRYVSGAAVAGRVYPFGHIWADGLPARAGQQWLTSRFHAHLLAAAAGASGIVVAGREGYYDVKHGSLLALGTGWTLVEAGRKISAADATSDPDFPARARTFAARKVALADALYVR